MLLPFIRFQRRCTCTRAWYLFSTSTCCNYDGIHLLILHITQDQLLFSAASEVTQSKPEKSEQRKNYI